MTETTSWAHGPRMLPDGTTLFRLWAPGKELVGLRIGDAPPRPMTSKSDGWCELAVENAGPGTTYGFEIDRDLTVPDPASRHQPHGVHGPSQLIDPGRYVWRAHGWRGRPWHEAVVYELHVGTFTRAGTFDGVRERLGALKELGVTAIELMPLADFAGERGWGYDGVLLYAPHAAYGSPDDLRALVDAAHQHELMVLLDVVYNHFGPDGNYLPVYCPRFFRHDLHTPWGPAIDYREPNVRAFAIENALYWLGEFRIDGLRLDAVHAIEDDSTPHLLDELAARVRERFPERHVHLVLENEHNEAHRLGPLATSPAKWRDKRARYDAQWNDDWHHCAHVLATGEDEAYYRAFTTRTVERLTRSAATGFVFQGEAFPGYEGRPRGETSAHLPPTCFVNFLQNHDQIGNRAVGERLTVLTAPRTLELFTSLLILSPQVPMLFMGEEWGTERPFLFFTDFAGELADAVREGRRREFKGFKAFADAAARAFIPDPNDVATFRQSTLDWDERQRDPCRQRLAFVRRLLELRARHIAPALAGVAGGVGEAKLIADRAFTAAWRLQGSNLRVLANVGDQPVGGVEPLPGAILFAWPDETAPLIVDGSLPGWSIVWFLEPVEAS